MLDVGPAETRAARTMEVRCDGALRGLWQHEVSAKMVSEEYRQTSLGRGTRRPGKGSPETIGCYLVHRLLHLAVPDLLPVSFLGLQGNSKVKGLKPAVAQNPSAASERSLIFRAIAYWRNRWFRASAQSDLEISMILPGRVAKIVHLRFPTVGLGRSRSLQPTVARERGDPRRQWSVIERLINKPSK